MAKVTKTRLMTQEDLERLGGLSVNLVPLLKRRSSATTEQPFASASSGSRRRQIPPGSQTTPREWQKHKYG
jgi:hypothetical protein